jgi:hypothetical protein
MHMQADTIDDLLRNVFESIIQEDERVVPSKGANKSFSALSLN